MAGNTGYIDNSGINFGQVSHKSLSVKIVGDTIKNLWDGVFGEINVDEIASDIYYSNNPFETSKKLTDYYSQIHSLGVIMREGIETHSFDNKM